MSVVGNSDAESSDEAVSCSSSKAAKDEEETAFEVPRPLQNHHRGLLKVPEDGQAQKIEQKQEKNRPKPLFNDSKLRWKNEPPWTEEKHRSYLNSMEEAFVRSLYEHGYRCSYPGNKRWQLSDKTVASQLGAKSKFSYVHIQETKPQKRTKRFKPRHDVDHHSNQVVPSLHKKQQLSSSASCSSSSSSYASSAASSNS